jgi:hypothetical protein
MTSADSREKPTTEVLDLYHVLPQADRSPARTEDDPVAPMIEGVGRNLAAIIGMFAVYLPAFIVCTTLLSLGVGLAVIGGWRAAKINLPDLGADNRRVLAVLAWLKAR